jgi:hypothetical protein
MPNIGKVTISNNSSNRRIRIRESVQTTIANPNFSPVLDLSIGELNDVNTNNVQDGFTLIYNSITQKYEAKAISLENLDRIAGGFF